MADENPVPDPGEGNLNQEEVERLVSEEEKPARSAIIRADGRRYGEGEQVRVETYDFRNPVFLTEIEMRHLRLLHEDFVRTLEAKLSLPLRLDFGLTIEDLTVIPYQKFTDEMKNPTHVCLFRADPLAGVGLLDVDPGLALTIAGRMLGGSGATVKAERHLTEIETDLTNEIFMVVVEEWAAQWRYEQALEPAIIGHEVNGRFLQTCRRDEMMLVLRMKGEMRDCAEIIQIGVPVFMVEPLVKQFQARRKRTGKASGAARKGEWRTAHECIRVGVTGQWEVGDMTVEEVLRLQAGHVIPLPSDLLQNTQLCLAGTPAFTCEAGVENGRVALRIKEKLEKEVTHGIK